ncbi:MAG: flagellar type III secretion system pore protein FliP [Planctomycetaceae bacterium]|nr:flagellar type III secretion system pore protein FliP [Planctomycetaceae bacterium]
MNRLWQVVDIARRSCPFGWLALSVCGLFVLNATMGHAQSSGGSFLPELIQEPTSPIELPNDSEPLSGGLSEAEAMEFFNAGPQEWTSPRGLSSSIQVMLLLTVLTLAPSILLMTTCFVRIIVVLGLLRQAIGAQQLPPSQVITSLSIFMTVLVMAPVWQDIKDQAVLPYMDQSGTPISLEEALNRGVQPLKRFMSRQISLAENVDDIWLFFKHLPPDEQQQIPKTWNDVPMKVLLPAFMISELKVAFLIGFQIYLPFLVIDLVISSLTISMGMMMLPPVIISLPFKLILFVLVDGWHLVVGMLMDSFAPYS